MDVRSSASDIGITSLDRAVAWAEENDIDIFFDGKYIPCPTTRGIMNAVNSYKEDQTIKAIREKFSSKVLATMGKPCSDFADKVVSALKDPEATASDVKKLFDGETPIKSWINDPEHRYSLLHFACRYDRQDCVRLALSHGCSPTDRTWTGNTPAYYAVVYGESRNVLDLLHASGPFGAATVCEALGPEGSKEFERDPKWTPNRKKIPTDFVDLVKNLTRVEHERVAAEQVFRKRKIPADMIDPIPEEEDVLDLLHHPDVVAAARGSIEEETGEPRPSAESDEISKKPRAHEPVPVALRLPGEPCVPVLWGHLEEESEPRMANEEEFACMICMDAPPDTIVHPCGHCVVCKDCSLRLRRTADNDRCVMCRNVIEWIDE